MDIGRYTVLGRLGRGGMGTVYKVRHRELGRIMALKLLAPREMLDELMGAEAVRNAFLREARLMGSCEHHHVAAVSDLDADRERPFMVMEYLGMNLGVLIGERDRQESATRPVPLFRALDFVRQMLDGLEYLHDHGIVHLDIKPANVMLDSLGTIKIIDFGLSRLHDHDWRVPKGVKIGTPGYCPPEQEQRPHDADNRADLFAAAVVLHRLLTGHMPGAGPFSTLSEVLWDFFSTALAANPRDRYPNAATMRCALDTVASRLAENDQTTCVASEAQCRQFGPLRAQPIRTGVDPHPFGFVDDLFRPLQYHDGTLEPVADGWLDSCTGLVWGEVSPWPMTWENARRHAEGLSPEGIWRLPTVEELLSLVRPDDPLSHFCRRPFDGRYLWVWTADRRSFTAAWFVDVGGGAVLAQDMSCRFHARPVRSV